MHKLYPIKSGGLFRFDFVKWYVDEEVSPDSPEEAWWIFSEKYIWWFINWRVNDGRKVYPWSRVKVCSLLGGNNFDSIDSELQREEYRSASPYTQEYQKFEGELNHNRPGGDWWEIGCDQGVIGEKMQRAGISGIKYGRGNLLAVAGKLWEISIRKNSLTLRLHVMKLCVLTYKIYLTDARQKKTASDRSLSSNMSNSSYEWTGVSLKKIWTRFTGTIFGWNSLITHGALYFPIASEFHKQ